MLTSRNAKVDLTFGIPAGKTCIGAGHCRRYCYAMRGCYRFTCVGKAQERRYRATLRSDFVDVMVAELSRKRKRVLRIHDSGDFYSQAYLDKWVDIAKRLPSFTFYCYTKSLNLDWSEFDSMANCHRTQSMGGRFDHLAIDSVSKCFVGSGKVYKSDKEPLKRMKAGRNINLKLRNVK